MNAGRWKVYLFGGLRVEPGRERTANETEWFGHPITRFSTQKTASLLGYLAFYRENSHPREVLIEKFWPGDNLNAGRHSLSMALSSLRHQLEPPGVPAGAVIVADRQKVGLNPQAVTTDVSEFMHQLRAAARTEVAREKATHLAEAVGTYAGLLLPGFYDEWVLNEQGQLEAQFVEAASALARLREAAGDLPGAVEAARKAAATETLGEGTQALLVRLLHAVGQTGEALRLYQEFARRLEEETGSAPGPELRRLRQRLEAHQGQRVAESPEVPEVVAPPPAPALTYAAAILPTGTVTFLFADWDDKPEENAASLSGWTEAFRRNGGVSLPADTGDVILLRWVFASAGDALSATIEAGKALRTADASALPRMALHTGDIPTDEAEEGIVRLRRSAAAEQAERLLAASQSGQVLVSETAVALLRSPSPQVVPGTQFTDLGLFRLSPAGSAARAEVPERLFRLEHPDLRSVGDMLPLPPRADIAYQAHLPLSFTRFFGREREIEDITRLLSDRVCRLLTLTGPGGIGKTRLSLQAAQRLIGVFQGRVCFVPLADVLEATRIPDAVLLALRLSPSPQQTPLIQIADHLQGPALLVLDNLEQVATEGARIVQEMLTEIPNLTLLVTSRQLLNLDAEREYPLGPLPAPSSAIHRPDQLRLFESVQVFVDRAQAVRPDFQVTTHNAPAIAALCERLEGLPLALELAASRAQVLTPAQMLAQLDNRFDFLVSRRTDKAARHRSLVAAIEWSYRLLTPELATFFTQLAVFRGGWTWEAAEAICQQPLALDFLAQLRECSLVITEETDAGAIRFRMLETIREYAWAQVEPEDRPRLQERHRNTYLAIAEAARARLAGPEQSAALQLLETEHTNLRAALDFTTAEAGQDPTKLQLAAALVTFWLYRGYLQEGAQYLQEALEDMAGAQDSSSADPAYLAVRAVALSGAAEIAWIRGDLPLARRLAEECVLLRRGLGDPRGIATALNNLGNIAAGQEDLAEARTLYEESLALYRSANFTMGIARTLNNIGALVARLGDLSVSRSCFAESLQLRRQVGDPRGIAIALVNLGNLEVDGGDTQAARLCYRECLEICRNLGEKNGIAYALDGFAEVYRVEGDPLQAARLLGATNALRASAEIRLPPAEQTRRERSLAHARASIDAQAFDLAYQEGESMTWEAACEFVLTGLLSLM